MALRDVLSYLITANDQTRGAVVSARGNLQQLQGAYTGVSTAMRAMAAAATGGIFALMVREIVQAGKATADVRIEMERMRNTLGQGVGVANVSNELTFLRNTANQFGLSFADAGIAYARFAAATRGTAIEGQQTRDMFVAMSKAAAALGMSAEQSAGALTALQQMVSKGTVSAEELRGQLGERLPGAFQIAARAMGVTTEQLGKMLEQGELAATDLFPRLTRQLEEEFGPAAERALGGAAAEVNRLGNEWTRLKEITASGFIGDLVMAGIGKLSEYLRALNADLTAVSLGMRNFLGIASGGLSNEDVEQFSREILQDPMMAGERRLMRDRWVAPDQPLPPLRGGSGKTDKQRAAEAAAAAREQYARDKEQLQADRDALRAENEREGNAVARQMQLLEARYRAGIQTEEDYYEQRRQLIAEDAAVRMEGLAKDSERLRSQKANGRDRIDLDRQIANNTAEAAEIEAEALAKLIALNIDHHGSLKKRQAAYEEARAAQQEFLDTAGRQQQAEVEGMGLGQEERNRRAGRNQIQDRYSQMRQQLESERRSGAFDADPGRYDSELKLIGEFQQKALEQYDAYYTALRAKHKDGFAGAREAMADYVTASQDSFSQVYGLMNTTFSSMGDVVADFATTGEVSFRRFRETVLAELSRIATSRILGMLVQMIGGGGGGGGSGWGTGAAYGNQDMGAYLATGTNYVPRDGFRAVLHEGEAVVPKAYNPAAGGRSGGEITIVQHNNFNFNGGDGTPEPAALSRMVRETAVAGVTEAQRRGTT